MRGSTEFFMALLYHFGLACIALAIVMLQATTELLDAFLNFSRKNAGQLCIIILRDAFLKT